MGFAQSTHNSQVPRRKNIRPPYNIDGKMHGSGLSYEEGDVSRDLPPLVSDVGNAKRKKLGRDNCCIIPLSSLVQDSSDNFGVKQIWLLTRVWNCCMSCCVATVLPYEIAHCLHIGRPCCLQCHMAC